MFGDSPFKSSSHEANVPDDVDVIFVADMFKNDYVGGAELTTDAIVTYPGAPRVASVRARNVTMQLLERHVTKWWVFGNFADLNPELIPSIAANLKYAIVEYDYKYCKYRSPEKHEFHTTKPCDCHFQINGKMVSAFFYGAEVLFWMSEAQKQNYFQLFPFLAERENVVLSSVFDDRTLDSLERLRTTFASAKDKWVVLGTDSWVKGFRAAERLCIEKGLDYEVVGNIPYEQALTKLAKAEGFVYTPSGADTCPRMVIEAKLLGCKLETNSNVQHAKESWFDTDDIESIFSYLRQGPKRFWEVIERRRLKKPSISGYTTTYNCVSQKYPFEQSIQSMLGFCDEVCVVDGGSTDGTWEKLRELQESLVSNCDRLNLFDCDESRFNFFNEKSQLKLKQVSRDWNHPRFAVFDGAQKAEARKMCTGDFCWQMDSDEVVHPDHFATIKELVRMFPKGVNLISLPVVEYWGGEDKVRMDVTPWKWRFSRNIPSITHGIPRPLRKYDAEGNVYASPGTDGCDMIDATTGQLVPHVSFYTDEVEKARAAALQGNDQAREAYETWFNSVVNSLPGVFHYSWFDLPRKIRTYKGYWGKHWKSLYDVAVVDTAENNMMFDKPWSEVTDADIDDLASRLKNGTGGWVWHRKWHGQRLPSIAVQKDPPPSMKGFYEESK